MHVSNTPNLKRNQNRSGNKVPLKDTTAKCFLRSMFYSIMEKINFLLKLNNCIEFSEKLP